MKRSLTILLILLLALQDFSLGQNILFPARENNSWGFIDLDGEWVISPQFEDAREFTEGLAAASTYGKWGFINKLGEWVIHPQFEMAVPFNEGLSAVVFENRWGFIDHDGEFRIQPSFHKVSSFSEGLALASLGEGYFYITHEGLNVGKEKFTKALPFAEGMAPIVVGADKGYVDNNGNLVIKHDFYAAKPFSEGRAQVAKNRRWGFIDRNGNVVIPLEYNNCSQFNEGLAAVLKKNKWGYIDKTGLLQIKLEYEDARSFEHGYAVVKEKGKYGVIDHKGKWVVRPEFEDIGQAGRSESIRQILTAKIQKAFNEWAVKGEFEKTDEYLDRMSPENQKEAMNWISFRIINNYGKSTIDFDKAEIGYYDADQEKFNIYLPGTLPTAIHVPITEALWFKENWKKGAFERTEFLLAGENLILSHYDFELSDSRYTFELEEGESYLYNYASIAWEEEIAVPEISWDIGSPDETTEVMAGTSDVDTDIPVSKYLNKNSFALIIGNENYRSFQAGLNDEIDVSFAAIDAEIFSQYAQKTLGVPEENITLISNGTAGQIKQALAKMNRIIEAYEGNAEILFYYAGHGLPDEITGKPYLIPVDVDGSDLSFAISLDDALNTLTEHEHKRITVFLDACFTGGGRNEGLIAARGVKIKPKSPFVKGNLILFSASSGNQSAFAYKEKAHGMFTYYLLKKLQETNGAVTFRELDRYLKDKVRKSAIIYNNKEQNPELMVSPSLDEMWRGMRLVDAGLPASSVRTLKP